MALKSAWTSHLTNKIFPYNSLYGGHNLVVSIFCHNFNSWIRVNPKSLYNASTIVHCEDAIIHHMNLLPSCLMNRSIVVSPSCAKLQLCSLSYITVMSEGFMPPNKHVTTIPLQLSLNMEEYKNNCTQHICELREYLSATEYCYDQTTKFCMWYLVHDSYLRHKT